MARVVFWSPDESSTGSTYVAIAVATLMGIEHKSTCLLMHGNYGSKKIETSFTPYDDLKNSGTFENSNIGVNALIRLVTSNKLSSDAIQNYAKPVLKERLDILYGMTQKDVEGYESLVNNLPYITRKADEVYDLVFVDIPKGTNKKYVLDTLADAEVIVCVVNQDVVKFDNYFNALNRLEALKGKSKIMVLGDYEAKSKYNAYNLKSKYRQKEQIYTVPHNFVFNDCCNDGAAVDFFYRNLRIEDDKDYNGYFIAQVRQIVEKILDITKIKDT